MSSLLHGLPTGDARQPLRVSQTALVLVIYVLFAIGQHLEVVLGLVDEAASWPLTAFNLAGGLLFFAATWAGLNVRWRCTRPLAMAQSLWAMAGIAWSYGITGPARGAVLLIMALIVIYGMFTMKAAQTRRIAAIAIGVMGVVMLFKARTDPGRYDPRVEAIHFIFFGIVMGACAVLSMRLGALRLALEQRGAELGAALARIQALATRDELTGLLNRRAALDCLRTELRDHSPRRPRLAVALIDLDHFKRINDGHGHAVGDAVLRCFAEVAGAQVRAGDSLARWGGEEFLLIMPGADLAQAASVVERVRERLREAPMAGLGTGLVVTFSAGLAICDDEAGLDRAIDAADRALYLAKERGRDRTVSPADCATLAVSEA